MSKGNSVPPRREDRAHHLPALRPPLVPPPEGLLRFLRVRRYGPATRLRVGEAEVDRRAPRGRGRDTYGSSRTANRSGRFTARRIPTRGPRTIRGRGPGTSRRAMREPVTTSAPSSSRDDPQGPTQPARAGGGREPTAHGRRGAHQDRLPRAGDEIRADDLVDPVHVERPGAFEHRPVSGVRPREAWFASSPPTYASVSTIRTVRTFPAEPTERRAPRSARATSVVGRSKNARPSRRPRPDQRILPRSQSGMPSTATVAAPIVIQER